MRNGWRSNKNISNSSDQSSFTSEPPARGQRPYYYVARLDLLEARSTEHTEAQSAQRDFGCIGRAPNGQSSAYFFGFSLCVLWLCVLGASDYPAGVMQLQLHAHAYPAGTTVIDFGFVGQSCWQMPQPMQPFSCTFTSLPLSSMANVPIGQ